MYVICLTKRRNAKDHYVDAFSINQLAIKNHYHKKNNELVSYNSKNDIELKSTFIALAIGSKDIEWGGNRAHEDDTDANVSENILRRDI